MTQRLLVWSGLDSVRTEVAHVEIDADRLRARGTQIGVDPEPYEVSYELETSTGFVTERLFVESRTESGSASLELVRGSSPELAWGPDCDLGFSPLTNTMPVLRHRLHEGGGIEECVMAWVSVPDLTVHRAAQCYTFLRPGLVRYEGLDSGFTAELELDAEGFVVRYPGLAERVAPPAEGIAP